MSVTTERPRFAGTPLAVPHWLEGPSGFPTGGVVDTGLGSGDDVLARARRMTLTRRQFDEVLAFTEFLAGCRLPDADRTELLEDLVDAFVDSPVSTTGFLRPLTGSVTRLAAMSPVERAVRRLRALTTTWVLEQRRVADGADYNPVMQLVHQHNPVVRHWASTEVVLVADVLAARVDQHRLLLALIGAEAEPAESLKARLLARVDGAGSVETADLAAAEVRLLCTRTWLRDLGENALGRVLADLDRAVTSALDVDIVVQQLGFRASLAVAARTDRPVRRESGAGTQTLRREYR